MHRVIKNRQRVKGKGVTIFRGRKARGIHSSHAGIGRGQDVECVVGGLACVCVCVCRAQSRSIAHGGRAIVVRRAGVVRGKLDQRPCLATDSWCAERPGREELAGFLWVRGGGWAVCSPSLHSLAEARPSSPAKFLSGLAGPPARARLNGAPSPIL